MCTVGCIGNFLEIFSPQSELREANPYTFYLGTVSGSSNLTILMRTCNIDDVGEQSRRPGLEFINILRATLRRWAVLYDSGWINCSAPVYFEICKPHVASPFSGGRKRTVYARLEICWASLQLSKHRSYKKGWVL